MGQVKSSMTGRLQCQWEGYGGLRARGDGRTGLRDPLNPVKSISTNAKTATIRPWFDTSNTGWTKKKRDTTIKTWQIVFVYLFIEHQSYQPGDDSPEKLKTESKGWLRIDGDHLIDARPDWEICFGTVPFGLRESPSHLPSLPPTVRTPSTRIPSSELPHQFP